MKIHLKEISLYMKDFCLWSSSIWRNVLRGHTGLYRLSRINSLQRSRIDSQILDTGGRTILGLNPWTHDGYVIASFELTTVPRDRPSCSVCGMIPFEYFFYMLFKTFIVLRINLFEKRQNVQQTSKNNSGRWFCGRWYMLVPSIGQTMY